MSVLIPQLRFSEFSAYWSASIVKNVTSYVDYRGKTPTKTKSGTLLVTAKNIKEGFIDYETSAEYIADEDYDNVMSRGKPLIGDVLFTTEAPMGNIAQVDQENIALAQRVIKFRGKSNLSNDFMLHYFLSAPFKKRLNKKAIGTTVKGIKGSELHKMPFLYPTLQEQQKIADFLSSVDKKIALLKEKHDLLAQYKKGVMQKLFSQEIRFKDEAGNDFPDWEEKPLSQVLEIQVREIPKPTEKYLALGIRSHMKGTFQKPNFDPESIMMEKLFIVRPNDLIVNITFAWEGAVAIAKKEDDGGLVSHRFPTYTFKDGESTHKYFKHIITLKRFKYMLDLISPGGAGRNRVLSKKEFLKLKWNFPSVEEQLKIADFLDVLDNKVKLVAQQIEHTQTFKKGLLQQMFV